MVGKLLLCCKDLTVFINYIKLIHKNIGLSEQLRNESSVL